MNDSFDAIDELVARSKDHRELRAFHQFHRQHPEVLDFLVTEIQRRIDIGFRAFRYGSLWDYARWKLEMRLGPGETYSMNDHAQPFYARAITILHPRFSGCAEFRRSRADDIFGTQPSRSRRNERTTPAGCNGRMIRQSRKDGGESVCTS